MSAPPIYALIPKQIERLSLHRFEWLRFPEPLEERFEQDISTYRTQRLWIETLIAIAFFNLFLFANHFLLHTISWKTLLVRSCLITPVALMVNVTMRVKPVPVYRELSIALAACWMCYTHLYLELGPYAMGPTYAQVGVIIVVLFTNVVMRLQFPYALAASVAMMAGDLIFLYRNNFEGSAEKIFAAMLTLCAISMTVMANYTLGRDERMGYLQRLRGEIQSAQLTVSNEELMRISTLDSLTGLANRHSFTNQYMVLWKQALTSRAPLSAVVIDIDNFKAVNDLCGHLYGDQVIKRVALLLQQALRGKQDFAARFGGEEFVVLLPGASPEVGMLVAERIRKLIEVAGTPALEEVPELPSVWATVSCGVATCWPTHTDKPDGLLEAADKALYEAKDSGRNCVCYGEAVMTYTRPHLVPTPPSIGQAPGVGHQPFA
ncbi:GGDEF domain-containing protein [Granulicella sp. dw_53]|uniref:GGDEF domain-containing protein n=1 Tax=Granulicella sp. dw_53 TaxID=2719792 RepID=UPI001BD4C1EB|nr:GGDEF domain-containing protein [Granulicella sp. dw_53]